MEEIIKAYLEDRAKSDETIAKNLKKPNKSIKECCEYITEQARKQAEKGVAAIQDEVVYGWAVHYYDEDSIKVKSTTPAKVMTGTNTDKGKGKEKSKPAKVVKLEPVHDKKGQFLLF